MTKFETWFAHNLTITSIKNAKNSDADIIINVSDQIDFTKQELCKTNDKDYYWFPMCECVKDMGVNSIYGAMIILNQAYEYGSTVALHCHAGKNRSQTVADAFFYMITKKHRLPYKTRKEIEESTSEIINFVGTVQNHETVEPNDYNKLQSNCFKGYLPPLNEMERWLYELHVNILNIGTNGGYLTNTKQGFIKNF